MERCFAELKRETFEEYYQQLERVEVYLDVRARNLRGTIFKTWKMILYHNKIEREASKFRLGTLFRCWNTVAIRDSKVNRRKALKFYYINLMRRIFDAWVDGVNTMRHDN